MSPPSDTAALDRIDESSKSLVTWTWLLILLGLPLQCLTIAVQPYVPLVDFPNHMARHVLEADQLAGRELPEFYGVHYRVVPNLGADLVVPPLVLVLGPFAACKLFLMLAVIVYWLGPALYLRQVNDGKPSALFAALLLVPLTMSSQFFWGFLNYYSGFGLAFMLLTHGVRLQRRETARVWEWPLHATLVALLFLWHLAAWGIYGVLMGSHVAVELATCNRQGASVGALSKRALAFVALWTPGAMLFAIYLWQKSGDGVGETNWGTLVRKLYMPLTLFRSYDLASDVIVIVTWLLAAGLLFVGSRRSTASDALPPSGADPSFPTVRTDAGSRPHLLGLVLLGGLYIAIPFQLGDISDIDSRLLPAILVIALAAVSSLPVRRFRWGVILLVLCLLVRQGSIAVAWHEQSRRLQAHAHAFDSLETHSRMLPLVLVPQLSKDYPETHFVCWAVVTHRAFVPTLFAYRDQPLQLHAPARLPAMKSGDGWEFDEAKVRESYDFVWIYNPGNVAVAMPSSFVMVFAAEGLKLWRVH